MDEPGRVWTGGTRLLGNLIPGLFCVPLLVAGILHFKPDQPFSGWPIYMLLFVAVGWTAVVLFGFWNNDGMRKVLSRRFDRRFPPGDETAPERFFVGIARPTYRNLLDPHEDIGFLVLAEDGLKFFGDTLELAFPWTVFSQVRRRANAHTWLGIGGWISLEGKTADGQALRLLIEPRENSIVVANWATNGKIRERLRAFVEPEIGVDSNRA